MTSFHNFFMIFVAFLHSSQTDTAVLQISHLVAFPFWPMSANFRKFAARVASCAFVLLGTPSKFLVMSRTFLKPSFYLCPHTRELMCCERELASRPGGGCCGSSCSDACPLPFSFSGVFFSAGQSLSFRNASSTACARKKCENLS